MPLFVSTGAAERARCQQANLAHCGTHEGSGTTFPTNSLSSSSAQAPSYPLWPLSVTVHPLSHCIIHPAVAVRTIPQFPQADKH